MPTKRKGISVASAKGKGRTGQQEVRDMLLNLFPELEADDIRSTAINYE
jgi:hypothetical protein